MPKLAVPIILLLGLIVASVWSDHPAPRAGFTMVERAEINTLDPAQMSWTQDLRVARGIYEGLLRHDVAAGDMRLVPAAAEAMPEISADRLTYTFRIRKDARWSTGEPVRASDFIYAWRRAILPDTKADYTRMFTVIRGVGELVKRREEQLAEFARDTSIADRPASARALYDRTLAEFDRTVGVRAEGERTIVVELARPVAYFTEYIAFPVFVPLHERTLRAFESIDPASGEVRWDPAWTRPPNLVTSGPFTPTVWRFKRDMRLERNPHYTGPVTARVDSISILNIADPSAMVTAFGTGAVDWTTDVQVPYRAEMLAQKRAFHAEHEAEYRSLLAQGLEPIEIDRRLPPDPRSCIHEFPSFGTYFLNFNCKERLDNDRPNPFRDPRVRRAFALCVDKEEIVRSIRRGAEPVAGSLIPPGSIAGYTPPRGLGFDPDRARAELAAAGYEGGKGLPEIEFLYRKDGGHDLIAQALQRNWERLLGVKIRPVMVEGKVFSERSKNNRFMMCTASWFGDYADPTTFLEINRGDDRNNDRRYSDPDYEALLDRAENEPDPAARMSILADAERLIVERDLPLIPVFHYTQVYLFDAHRIAGLTAHPRQVQHLFLIDVLDDGQGPHDTEGGGRR